MDGFGNQLWIALALMLVVEGMVPFLSPAWFKRMLATALLMEDRALRVSGFVTMIGGLILLYAVK